jgi:hypothetical protein
MFVPSLKRFELNPYTQRYEKRFIINDKLYLITIPKEQWTRNLSKVITKWLNDNADIRCTFPYGIIKHQTNINIYDVKCNACEFCGKKLINIRTKRRHMEKCKFKDTNNIDNTQVTEVENIREPVTKDRNITNITNNNNITINNYIQICDFGKENQEWLTQDVLKCLFLDRKTAVKHLIRSKHFNEKFPENKNIRLDTKSNINRRLQVYSNGRWRIREAKPVINSTFVNTHEIITDLLNVDDPPYDDDHQSQVIKDFQGTDKFQNKYNRLLRKWEDFGQCIQKEDTEFQEYWEYIKTLLLDQKLMMEQQEITQNKLTQ